MKNYRLAFFISPHGFGHAARAAAVMQALRQVSPAYEFEIFTRVPRWFFAESVTGQTNHHQLDSDVGLVQLSSLNEDIPATLTALQNLYPFKPERLKDLADQVQALGCEGIVCDIAPLGIAVAQVAGIPSILVENFTWDWIYGAYVAQAPQLSWYIDYLAETFAGADYHIQTEPVCNPRAVDALTRPVSRAVKTAAAVTRRRLGIPSSTPTLLITMGGIPEQHVFINQLAQHPAVYFIIPGGSDRIEVHDNVARLPHHSEFYHPDLLNASDAVIGKSGYSTVAEAYYAGIPFGYISRPRFRESSVIAQFIHDQMQGFEIPEAEFRNGQWLDSLPELLSLPRIERSESNGARQVARFIHRALI